MSDKTDSGVLTARAWGPKPKKSGKVAVTPICATPHGSLVPVIVVHGVSDSDIRAGLSLLAKSRGVCEHYPFKSESGNFGRLTACGITHFAGSESPIQHDRPCWCGRRVEVKE